MDKLRNAINRRVREIRLERRWTQDALADLLGLSQNRLSEIERGGGSFTAEQLVTVLRTFNVQVDTFVPPKDAVSELQNALARLGATHLFEIASVLPSERLKEALTVIREVLAAADSSRQVAALAPVLVNNADSLNLTKLTAELAEIGLSRRLGWVVDNTIHAIEASKTDDLSPRWRIRYQSATLELSSFLSRYFKPESFGPSHEDVLDSGIGSKETLDDVMKERSAISRRWRIVTGIQPDDFRRALKAAHGYD